MMKFITRVKNIMEKQIFVLREQIKKIKQTTPIKRRKNPVRRNFISREVH